MAAVWKFTAGIPVLSVSTGALTAETGRATLKEALTQVADHNIAALRQVYDLTSGKLFGICLRICGDRNAAEEVMQDVLIKIWSHAASYDATRSSPITWLCAIARNTAIDWLRAHDRQGKGLHPIGEDVADHSASAEQQLLDMQEQARLHVCLNDLEERQRLCIRAAFFDGLTYADLANEMGAPLNTVKTWVRRGMQRLKACLSDG